MNADFSQFINTYDILFFVICLISIFFGIKNGIIKSVFNLIKWIIIFYLLKNCFNYLRPIVDQYILNQTISDIFIFFFTLITSYIFISFLNRLIIGLIQPKKSGLIDIGFGALLGALRGYIVFVIFVFFTTANISSNFFAEFLNSGSLSDIVNYGVDLIDHMPRNLNKLDDLST